MLGIDLRNGVTRIWGLMKKSEDKFKIGDYIICGCDSDCIARGIITRLEYTMIFVKNEHGLEEPISVDRARKLTKLENALK